MMIRVTIEQVDEENENTRFPVGVLDIWESETIDDTRSSYDYIYDAVGLDGESLIQFNGTISGYRRQGEEPLILAALKDIYEPQEVLSEGAGEAVPAAREEVPHMPDGDHEG